MNRELDDDSYNSSETIEFTVLGESYKAQAADCALRNLHMIAFAEPQRYFFHSGYYCWNDRCKTCLVDLERSDGQQQHSIQACKFVLQDGDKITKIPENMSKLDQ